MWQALCWDLGIKKMKRPLSVLKSFMSNGKEKHMPGNSVTEADRKERGVKSSLSGSLRN